MPSSSSFVTVDGGWSSWSTWTKCTKTCQTGIQARMRKCKQPAPRDGGRTCQGAATEQRKCNTQPCAGKYINPFGAEHYMYQKMTFLPLNQFFGRNNSKLAPILMKK